MTHTWTRLQAYRHTDMKTRIDLETRPGSSVLFWQLVDRPASLQAGQIKIKRTRNSKEEKPQNKVCRQVRLAGRKAHGLVDRGLRKGLPRVAVSPTLSCTLNRCYECRCAVKLKREVMQRWIAVRNEYDAVHHIVRSEARCHQSMCTPVARLTCWQVALGSRQMGSTLMGSLQFVCFFLREVLFSMLHNPGIRCCHLFPQRAQMWMMERLKVCGWDVDVDVGSVTERGRSRIARRSPR